MKSPRLLALLLLALPAFAQADHTWILDQSILTYHMSHPLHEVDGVSHAACGKGVCHAGQCDFLLAVQVKTFDSGDTNRDLHMLQVTRGAEFPVVTVRFGLPEASIDSPTLDCDLDVQLPSTQRTMLTSPFTGHSRQRPIASLALSLRRCPISRSIRPRSSPSHQERHPRARRYDLAPAVGLCLQVLFG
jgi:hypothetical protein